MASHLSQTRFEDHSRLGINEPKLALETEFGRIDYIRTGKKDGKTLLLIPGVPDQIYTFHRLIQELLPEYDVVAVNPPGKGFSTYAPRFDFSINASADFWRMMIKELNLKNVTVVAHSFGLAEILHALLRYGKEDLAVDSLVSVCGWAPALLPESLPFFLTDQILGSDEGAFLYRSFSENKYFGLLPSFARTFYRWFPKHELETLARQYFKSWPKYQPKTRIFDNHKLLGICRMVREQNRLSSAVMEYFRSQRPHLPQLKNMPVLVVGASHDELVHGPQDRETLDPQCLEMRYLDKRSLSYAHRLFHGLDFATGRLPENQLQVFSNTGHMLPLENPRDLSQAIHAFLKQLKTTLLNPLSNPMTESHLLTQAL